jgi:hypothetical protein
MPNERAISGVLAGASPDASSSRNGTASSAQTSRLENQMRSVKITTRSMAHAARTRERCVLGRDWTQG